MTPVAANYRRLMIAKVHVGAKDLGLSDDARRDLMQRLTGCSSAKDMINTQLDQVLTEYARLGWKPKPKRANTGPVLHRSPSRPAASARKPAEHPVARKARAMWISLGKLGAIDNPAEQALEAFAKRQVGCDAMRFMDQGQGFKLIEALKVMAERAGWSQDVGRLNGRQAGELLQRRLDALLAERGAR